ncbi:MAG: hypothetical protein D3922_17120 [Candidatus Electrothrix sp. AR1]|nr:hypothetical protein [Candidatus Electrothrix sp. AR1]
MKRKKKNSAQARLIRKMRASGKKVSVNTKGIEKMSEVIENFAEPLLADCRSDNDIKNAIQFAVVVWNLTMFPEDEQDKRIQELVETLSTPGNIDQINQVKLEINSFINRKKKMFPHIQRVIIDCQFSGAGSSLRLDIASKDR